MSLRAYAVRRNVSLAAVQKAIKEGRLEKSLGEVRGRRAIVDPDLADREWAERTRPRPAAMAAIAATGPATVVNDDEPIPADTPIFEAERVRAVELARRERIKRETDALELAKR